jgi:molybdenum cofactor cytidylyltransferase
MFTPVDYPLVEANTVAAIADAFRGRAAEELLAIPRFGGKRGHPVAISREVVEEMLALPSDAQARDVIRRHHERARWVEVDDPGILEDADDPESYRRLVGGPGP